MKINEIREIDEHEINSKMGDLKKELFNLKFQKAFGMLESPARIRLIKKDIARCNTVATERKIKASR